MIETLTPDQRSLHVYAAGPRSLIKQLIADFEESTGIRVKLVQAPTGRMLAQLEAEAASPQADVFISASWDLALELEARDWLLSYRSPNANRVPELFKTDCCVAHSISALAIAWNRKSGTPRPTDWQDLTLPPFRMAFTMPDPSLSGTSADLLMGLDQARGEGAWELFAGLLANGMSVAGSNDQALAPVIRGDKAAAFGAVDYMGYASLAKGADIEVIYPTSGTFMVPRPMMILKSTAMPEQAKALIDFMLSEQGQTGAAHSWLMPARDDMPSRRPPFSAIKHSPALGHTCSNRERVLQRFHQLSR